MVRCNGGMFMSVMEKVKPVAPVAQLLVDQIIMDDCIAAMVCGSAL